MNKQELINATEQALGDAYTKSTIGAVLKALTDVIVEEVAQGGDVALVGFGTFKGVQKAERQGRNPKTGEAITIPAQVAVQFKPGQAFKDAANA